MSSPAASQAVLCLRCQTLDLKIPIILNETDRTRSYEVPDHAIALGPSKIWSQHCQFCHVLKSILKVDGAPDPSEQLDLRTPALPLNAIALSRTPYLWPTNLPLNGIGIWACLDSERGIYKAWSLTSNKDTTSHWRYDRNERSDLYARTLQVSQEYADISSFRHWIDECKGSFHKRCQRKDTPLPKDVQVIDCRLREVCNLPTAEEYLTLSYVWGENNNHSSSLLPGKTPRLIEDAISVTLGMGYQYLWVDRYCVDQQSEQKFQQIAQMDLIYICAVACIIAVVGNGPDHGLCGVSTPWKSQHFVNPKGTVCLISSEQQTQGKQTEWGTRGWTYQEGVLSRRRIMFFEDHVHFECTGRAFNNPDHIPEKYLFDSASLVRPRLGYDTKFNVESVWEHILIYSRRTLRNPEDILSAMLGVLNASSRAFSHIHSISGIVMGNKKPHDFCHYLTWYNTAVRQRRVGFPSWSWIGWIEPLLISYPEPMSNSTHYFDHVKANIIIVREDSTTATLDEYFGTVSAVEQAVKHASPSRILISAPYVSDIVLEKGDRWKIVSPKDMFGGDYTLCFYPDTEGVFKDGGSTVPLDGVLVDVHSGYFPNCELVSVILLGGQRQTNDGSRERLGLLQVQLPYRLYTIDQICKVEGVSRKDVLLS
jgi:hypothetical protein